MVYQETSLVPQLTVAQNIVLGREKRLQLGAQGIDIAARQVLQRLNFKVDPSQLAGSLSAAQAADGGDRARRASTRRGSSSSMSRPPR